MVVQRKPRPEEPGRHPVNRSAAWRPSMVDESNPADPEDMEETEDLEDLENTERTGGTGSEAATRAGGRAAAKAAAAQRRAKRARTPRGPASLALKEMRVSVRLSQRQMAAETGLGKQSSYQYLEDDYKKDYFDVSTVRYLIEPLAKRGIPRSEIEKRLLGTTASGVSFPPNDDGRDVPVLSRAAAADVARGKLNVSGLKKLPTARLRRLEDDAVVLGWYRLRDVSDETLVLDVEDGAGSQVAVDPGQKALEEGRSYVFSATRDPVALSLGTWRSGCMVLQEGVALGRAVPFDPEEGIVLGRVVWFMRRM